MNVYDSAVQRKKTTSLVIKISFLLLLLLYFTSCANILTEFGNTTSTEALIVDIKKTMNTDYASALVKFNALPATLQVERASQVLLAKIYGGLCGINFFDLTSDVGSDPALFIALINAFPGATTAEADYCILAESTIAGIGGAGVRTVEENLLMVYVTWGKIGTILEAHGDPDGDDVYATFDPCSPAELPSDYAKHLLTSVANMSLSFTAIGSGSGTGSGVASSLASLCGAVPGVCSDTDIANVDAGEEDAIRTITKDNSQDFGLKIKACGGCPCP